MARFWTALLLIFVCGCGKSDTVASLTLATTTSTQDSGLLDVLMPLFEEQTRIKVKVIAVGSGQALELGRRGDADVLLTHAPAAEVKFMSEDFGSERHSVMHNDFVLVGPKYDPAKVRGQRSVTEAVRIIVKQDCRFVSRSDESGTHQKEREIWKEAGADPKGAWYIKAGSGMAQALRMASEKEAYTLSDRATFLVLQREVDLVALVQGDSLLMNRYSVILVNPKRHSHVHHTAARQFVQFLLSEEAQDKIANYGKEKYGEPLFFPDADKHRK
jgi:tungstate transport system substrate-binding protein